MEKQEIKEILMVGLIVGLMSILTSLLMQPEVFGNLSRAISNGFFGGLFLIAILGFVGWLHVEEEGK